MPNSFQLATDTAVSPNAFSYWVIENQLLAGAYPGSPNVDDHQQRLKSLIDAGIHTYLNLMEQHERDHQGRLFVSYAETVQSLRSEGSCTRIPIPDLSVPSKETMVSILDTIDESLGGGRPAYVHCWGGVGRTGTVIGCWMLRHGLASREDIFDVLRQLRRQDRERGGRESPETAEQREFVRTWDLGDHRG